MEEKGCDNCYYEYFDEKAYPCSLCIRGIKRTDKWMPSKKTKAEIQKWTKENCKGCKYNEYPYDSGTCFVRVCINGNKYEPKAEPQTEENEIPEYAPWRDAFDSMDCCSMEVQDDNGNDID